MTIKEFFSFKHNALLWGNLIAMVVVAVVLVFVALKGVDAYTHHGEAVRVPDVKGIGKIVPASEGCAMITRDNTEITLRAQGWNPLKGDSQQ